MKPWQHILLGFLIGMTISAILFIISGQPKGNSITLSPAPTTSPIFIDISGAVNNPGAYSLLPGSRVKNAVSSAGGLTNMADRNSVNLAAILEDGQKVYIPSIGETRLSKIPLEPSKKEGQSNINNGGLININSASLDELMLLPGIGETRAKQIIEYRDRNGAFTALDEIMKISGIGVDTFEEIKQYITLE